jgi:hypothetical protein
MIVRFREEGGSSGFWLGGGWQIRVTGGDLIDSIYWVNPFSPAWGARSDGPGSRGSGTLQEEGIFVEGKDPAGLSTNYNYL